MSADEKGRVVPKGTSRFFSASTPQLANEMTFAVVWVNEYTPSKINAQPMTNIVISRAADVCVGANIFTSKPERSITKPKAINARLVRFQANSVRSAANRTLGSFKLDITKGRFDIGAMDRVRRPRIVCKL